MSWFEEMYSREARQNRRDKEAEDARVANENAANREQGIQKSIQDYSNPNNRTFSISGTQDEKEAQMSGLNMAKLGYGQGLPETGQDISRIRELQKKRTDLSGMDPVSSAIMAQKASATANAKRDLAQSGVKGGVAAGAVDAVSRQRDADIAASLYGQQRQSLQDERSLASNTLAGTVAMQKGAQGEAVKMPTAPEGTGIFGTVICTELYRQGLMDYKTYNLDSEYGIKLYLRNPNVIYGYHYMANPVVKLMKKSKVFTKIVSIPALNWANHIAGKKKSLFGYFCQIVGERFCGMVGKILKICKEKHHEIYTF